MGKAAMCIRMLQILNTGRVFRVSELAELLETNPRNIIEYKKELDEIVSETYGCSGFYIETIPGRYGGYKLNGNIAIPSLKLLEKEREALSESYNYVLSKKDFVRKKELINAFSKVMSNLDVDDKNNKYLAVDKYQLSMNEEDIRDRYEFIEKAINEKSKIEIVYHSLKDGVITQHLDPYKLYLYNNSWFFLAWNQEVGEVWYYKVNRIEKYKMLDEHFTVHKYFKAEDYIDEYGMKNNGEYFHVVFIATRVRAMLLEERIYGKNQVVTKVNDNEMKVEIEMQNNDSMISFFLSCGTDIKIIEPTWLIEKIKEKAKEMLNIYG